MHWLIFDNKTNKKYIDVKYKSEREAKKELANLLRPYPANHEWRKRLFVKPGDPVVESPYADQES